MKTRIFVLFAVAVALVSCSLEEGKINSIPSLQETEPIMDIVNKETKRKAEVRLGMPFFVELPSNPTTGYMWTVKNETLKNINLVDKTLNGKTNKMKTKRVGAASTQTFAFLPKIAGEEEITFRYERSWEKDEIPTTYTINIKINSQ